MGGRNGTRLAIRRGDFQLALAGQPSVAVEHGHAILLHQVGHALAELRGNGAGAGHHGWQVGGGRGCAHAKGRRVPDQPQHIGGAQERLGGNAAPVQADAAQVLFLDQRGFHAELRGTDRCHVAARAAADDDQVK